MKWHTSHNSSIQVRKPNVSLAGFTHGIAAALKPDSCQNLNQKIVQDSSMHIRQAKIPSLKTVGQFYMVEPQQMKQCRM